MPLTPEANLAHAVSPAHVISTSPMVGNILDQLLSLNIVQAVDTGDTVTVCPLASSSLLDVAAIIVRIPNSKDSAGLGETRLLLHATDSLFQDGGHLGGLCL